MTMARIDGASRVTSPGPRTATATLVISGLVDNGDTQRARPIAGCERSPGQQADARGFEIAVGNLVDADTAILLGSLKRTLDRDLHSTVAAQRAHTRSNAGGRYTRHLAHPLHEAAPDRAEPRMVGVELCGSLRRDRPARHRGLDLHRQHALAIETRRNCVQVVKRSQKERGAAEQEDRQRDLNDDQRSTKMVVRRRSTGSAGFRGIDARRAQGRGEAEKQRGRDGHAGSKAQHAQIEMRIEHHPFSGAGEDRNQERRTPPREEQSSSGAQRHQDDAFGQQLTYQPAAAGANREPHSHLVLPRRGARQQQVGNIGAADEQHDADDRHHDHQRLRVGAAQPVRAPGRGHERYAAEVAAPVARHPDFRQVGVPQRLEIRACRLDGRAGREAPDHAQPPALLRLQSVMSSGSPT